jgi:Serine dehydrogenase proteinase
VRLQRDHLGKQSNLGPIDPQMGGMPAHGVLLEFEQAVEEIKKDPSRIQVWQLIIGKYHPTFLQECKNAIALSKEVVHDWLVSGMFKDDKAKKQKAAKIVSALSDYEGTKTHGRHLHLDHCNTIGLKITAMEDDQVLQDLILTVHHSFILTVSEFPSITKIVENHNGIAMISSTSTQQR